MLRIICLICLDVPAVLAAYLTAYLLKFKLAVITQFLFDYELGIFYQHAQIEPYLDNIIWVCIIWIICLFAMDAYRLRSGVMTSIEQGVSVFKATSLASIVLMSSFLIVDIMPISRYLLIYAWIFGTLYLMLNRLFLDKVGRFEVKKAEGACIVGAGRHAQILLERLLYYYSKTYLYEGSIYKNERPEIVHGIKKKQKKIASSLDIEIIESLRINNNIKHFFIATQSFPKDEIDALVLYCKQKNIRCHLAFSYPKSMEGLCDLTHLEGVPMISVTPFFETPLYDMSKRVFDSVLAIILMLLLSPFLMLIGGWIKIVSPKGSVLYAQERVGKNQARFMMYKFRTMYVDAEKESGPTWVSANDTRYIFGGRFLRRFSLDEWPQLINIVKNDMSFIGPRPERPFFVEQILQDVPYFNMRHLVKGGITGWAQIHGRAFLTNKPKEKCRYDLYYIKNRSWIMDLKILCKTFFVIFRGEEAY